MHGFHHLRARVRMTQGLERFPSSNVWKRFLDYLMYGVGIFGPLALLPQILQLYGAQSAEGLSLFTWCLLTGINVLWGLYGLAHKDKHLFIAHSIFTLFDLSIVVGILLY